MKPLIFIHIPKTGGTYLGQREHRHGTVQPVITPCQDLNHCTFFDGARGRPAKYPPENGYTGNLLYDEAMLRGRFVFANVRNPYDFLVSYWGHAAGHNPKYRNLKHYDYKAARRGFDYLLKTIADRDDPQIWPNRRFIHFQMFSYHGRLLVDWINHQDRLADFVVGAQYHQGNRMRDGMRASRDWRPYYETDDQIDLVARIWERELRLFGYDFDGATGVGVLAADDGHRGCMVSKETRTRIRYSWMTDVLTGAWK